VFDSATYKSARNFQSRHLDKRNTTLEVDGKVGDLTGRALRRPRNRVSIGAIEFGVMTGQSAGGSETGRLPCKLPLTN
jgi:hypothetical protein